MKKIIITFAILFTQSMVLTAQTTLENNLSKVNSLDNTIKTLYSVISGEIGEARDWELMKFLFHPDAKLIPTGKTKDGKINIRYLTIEDYISTSGKWLVENGFYEKEIARSVDTFGNITQVFSTYESFRSEKDTNPFMRGINSIQLFYDGERWWIINIYWTQESEQNPIPTKYLRKI